MEFESSDNGCFKIQVKPQKGRPTIVVLMHKVDHGKFTQKLQIVVKPSELPLADCMAILQLVCLEITEGKLGLSAIKFRRDELIQSQKSVGLKKYFEDLKDQEAAPPYDYRPNEEFLQAYIENQQQVSHLPEVADADDNTEEKPCHAPWQILPIERILVAQGVLSQTSGYYCVGHIFLVGSTAITWGRFKIRALFHILEGPL